MRNLCITLLLALVVSNAMIGVHAATHVSADPNECELCTAYGDPSAVVPTSDLAMPVVAQASDIPSFRRARCDCRTVLDLRPRGPPHLI